MINDGWKINNICRQTQQLLDETKKPCMKIRFFNDFYIECLLKALLAIMLLKGASSKNVQFEKWLRGIGDTHSNLDMKRQLQITTELHHTSWMSSGTSHKS